MLPPNLPIVTDVVVPSSVSPLLAVRNLEVRFRDAWGWRRHEVRAVDGVSFTVAAGETLALVGESGCGKSTTLRAILRLVAVHGGTIEWKGRPIQAWSDRQMRPVRAEMQMVFQDPFSSLNPRMTVGEIVAEPLHIFHRFLRSERKLRVMDMLHRVGLNPRWINRYPHEFSGGQRQRIGIARALILEPDLLLCDEPVSALDVSIQAQILNLLKDLQQSMGLSYLFISHDLSVVRHVADRVGVMYQGRIVEEAEAATLFGHPQHPYTQSLLAAVPLPIPRAKGLPSSSVSNQSMGELPGTWNTSCAYAPRCPWANDLCRQESPVLADVAHNASQRVACFRVQQP